MIRSLFMIAALALTGCATAPPPYTPASAAGGAGYSERQIESDRYFVTYRAGGAADAAVLQDYALLRAAELTLERGRDWFWVDRRALDEERSGYGGPSIGVGVGAGSWGGRSGGSVGVGVNFPIGGDGRTRARSATIEIRLGQGPKPDDPNAYDARAISTNIRARLAPAG